MAYDVLWPPRPAPQPAQEDSSRPAATVEHRLRPGDVHVAEFHDALRIACDGYPRGELTLDVQLKVSPKKGLGLSLCATKSGSAPDLQSKEFHWVSARSEEGSTGWRCRIQTHWWVFSNPDIVLLPILDTEAPTPDPEIPTFTGVDFEPINGELPHAPDGPDGPILFQASLSFCSEEDAMPTAALRLAHTVYHQAFKTVDGLELSAVGKEGLGRDGDLELTYGEVQFAPFYRALHCTVAPQPGEIFVDLGSGTGRAVIAMALGFPELQRCVGLELLGTLHNAAECAAASMRAAGCPSAPVELRSVNFLEENWEVDADIVWVSSLCMAEETLDEIARRACGLKKGSRVVTMDSTFGDGMEGFERLCFGSGDDAANNLRVEMSFGEGSIYVVRRTVDPSCECVDLCELD